MIFCKVYPYHVFSKYLQVSKVLTFASFPIARKTYYKRKNRYDNNGIDGLHDLSRIPHTIKYKVDTATEETILDLRLKRFGCNRIRFRLKRFGVCLSSRTIYKILKRHYLLNIFRC